MSDRIRKKFEQLKEQNRAAFMPFLTLGDPDLETSQQLTRAVTEAGADLVELGVPFSDPIADGPIIQASYTRALRSGFRLKHLFQITGALREQGVEIPLVAMASVTLVEKAAPEEFFQRAREAGIDGAILPDLPADRAEKFAAAAAACQIPLVFLCAPNTSQERRKLIAGATGGFLYYMSITGITGIRDRLPADIVEQVRDLKTQAAVPVCVGFGISRPAHARAVAKIADGVIVGSAIVKKIQTLAEAEEAQLVAKTSTFVKKLAEATHSAR